MYVDLDDLYEYLSQVKIKSRNDTLFKNILNRSQDIVNKALGFSFKKYTKGLKSFPGTWTRYLPLPSHRAGSVSFVSWDGGTELLGWKETASGMLYAPYYWSDNYLYSVEAEWGYGPPPDSIKEVVLELAVNIWRSRDAGRFTNVVFSGEGRVGYEGALTPLQKMVINDLKSQHQQPIIV